MKLLRFFFLSIALLGLGGWFWLHKPHSPTDDLPPVANIAFQVNAPTPQAGQALAEAARGWKGVTATTYNPQSDLLVIIYTPAVNDVRTLQAGLQTLTPRPISQKIFQMPAGPQCPVSPGMLTALPGTLLAIGAGAFLLFLAMTYRRKSPVLSA